MTACMPALSHITGRAQACERRCEGALSVRQIPPSSTLREDTISPSSWRCQMSRHRKGRSIFVEMSRHLSGAEIAIMDEMTATSAMPPSLLPM